MPLDPRYSSVVERWGLYPEVAGSIPAQICKGNISWEWHFVEKQSHLIKVLYLNPWILFWRFLVESFREIKGTGLKLMTSIWIKTKSQYFIYRKNQLAFLHLINRMLLFLANLQMLDQQNAPIFLPLSCVEMRGDEIACLTAGRIRCRVTSILPPLPTVNPSYIGIRIQKLD